MKVLSLFSTKSLLGAFAYLGGVMKDSRSKDLERKIVLLKAKDDESEEIKRFRKKRLEEIETDVEELKKEPISVFLEDIISARLYEAERNLHVALELFNELKEADEEKQSCLFEYEESLNTASSYLHIIKE